MPFLINNLAYNNMAYNNLASKKLMFQFRCRKCLYIISQLLSTISKCRFMCIAFVVFVSSLNCVHKFCTSGAGDEDGGLNGA